MATSISTPADMINLALTRIGYKGRVGSLYEGSTQAKKALDIYAQTRDAVLREYQWGFAEKNITAALTAGGVAPTPWSLEYVYPADCIQIRDIFDNAAFLIDKNNPRPVLYTIASAASGVAKAIWTNTSNLVIVYTARVTDPALWEPLFIELLAVELGKRLAPVLSTLDAEKMELEDEKIATPMAEGIEG